jgi:hypothetical protein
MCHLDRSADHQGQAGGEILAAGRSLDKVSLARWAEACEWSAIAG